MQSRLCSSLPESGRDARGETPRSFTARGVVWDIDGTLIDSEPLHLEALLVVSEKHGCTIGVEENKELLGLSLEAVWEYLQRRHGLNAEKTDWMQWVTAYYLEHVSPSMARLGVLEQVQQLGICKVPQACVSTAERQVVDANLEALGIAHLMSFSLSREDVTATKPDPEAYVLACRRLGFPPAQCLAIEDTEVGVTAAHLAGLITVAWPHRMSAGQSFVHADYLIAELREIPWFCEISAIAGETA